MNPNTFKKRKFLSIQITQSFLIHPLYYLSCPKFSDLPIKKLCGYALSVAYLLLIRNNGGPITIIPLGGWASLI